MQIDRNGLEVLPPEECIALLSTVNVGRIGLSLNALPVIFTVNFALDGADVVFRTRPDGKLKAALAGQVVSFQADRLDEKGHFGWSVSVTGQALVADEDRARLDQLGLINWLIMWHWIRVSPDVVTGRRRNPATSNMFDLRHSSASAAQ